jgi:HAD superfamily hydrolase (TIGR01509 family)
MSPELVIFDCDGVLVDSEPIANRILVAALDEAGLRLSLDEVMVRYVGRSMASVVALAEDELGQPLPDGFLDRVQALTFAAFRRELRPIPGVAEALAALSMPVCVASSGSPEKIALSLSLTGLDRFFHGKVFSASEVARGKPHPDLFLYAARRMAVAEQACIVIEDSLPGIEAAKAAGMRVFGFSGGGHGGENLAMLQRDAGAIAVAKMADLPRLVTAL